ncbi:MAG: glycosyltransferase family 9 protein [Vicinamibacterales bacterium]
MKVLLVRLRQIGDVVFTTPTLAALANHFPGVELTYLVEPSAAPVVSGNPHVSRVLVAPRRPGIGGLLDDIRLGGELRRMQFDIVLDFHGGPRASLLTWLSRAPRRVGYEIKGRAWMYRPCRTGARTAREALGREPVGSVDSYRRRTAVA